MVSLLMFSRRSYFRLPGAAMAATASIIAAIPDLEGKFSGRSTRRASLSPAKVRHAAEAGGRALGLRGP